MKTSIIYTKEIWSDDDFYKLHLDSKFLYWFILSSPDRGYITVYKWRNRFASMYTGILESQLESALEELSKKGFIEIYEGYICIKKLHVARIGGPYGAINANRELETIPVEVRRHFNIDDRIVIEKVVKKPNKKTGPPPETIKEIIARQPEALREALTNFVEDRKERKRPPTTRAVKGWISKLEKMYPNNPEKQSESLQQSIERGWMGIFEVKDDVKKESTFL